MTSDEVLILQFQAGSRDSFEELFSRYRQPIYAFFRRRLGSAGTAEDLAQELWIAVVKGVVRYEPRAPFRAYLYGIAFKLLAAERRRSAKENTVAVSDMPVSSGHPFDATRWVREALDKLDSTEREIVMLREYEQLSYEEIAELLHIPLNTVRSRLFRARLAIKQLLEPNSTATQDKGGCNADSYSFIFR